MGYITKQCPQCGHEISWLQKWRFASPYAARRVRPCPHCGTRLRWSRIPWYILNVAGVGFIAILLLPIRGSPFLLLFCALGVIAGIAAAFCRFKVMEPCDEKAEATVPQGQIPEDRDSEE